jgi:hypothetical protein
MVKSQWKKELLHYKWVTSQDLIKGKEVLTKIPVKSMTPVWMRRDMLYTRILLNLGNG